jgi:hypothetical protein
MKQNKLALNLSKTSIQLLKKSGKHSWYVLGSVDPSSKNLEKDLDKLRKQAAALSTKKPIVDVLLPRELVLSQTIVIENNFSVEYCKKMTAKRCGLNESEILIAIGESKTKSTVPVAAISANSIKESRNFVRRAGFRPEKYIASSKISGFKKSPVFFNDNSSKRLFDLESKTFTNMLAVGSILLFAGFLVSLTTEFLEYRSNNKPFSYLSNAKMFDNYKLNDKETLLRMLAEAKHLPQLPFKISIFEPSALSSFDYHQKSKSPFPTESQSSANLKVMRIKKITLGERNHTRSFSKDKRNLKDFEVIASLQKEDLIIPFPNQLKNARRMLPKMEEFVSPVGTSSKQKTKYSKESKTLLTSSESKRTFVVPAKERSINHEYRRILIEEVFSDISLTKILITAVNKRASTLPLIYSDIKKPDIFNPSASIAVKYHEKDITSFIKPIGRKPDKISFIPKEEASMKRLTLDRQLNLKLKKQGIDVKLLENIQIKKITKWNSWVGQLPYAKPKIIDNIKVLDDPTKSTGAVTFVELPPGMPIDVRKIKKVSASSIKNLKVRSNPPSIPQRASIVGNSTLKNLIELNRTNLIGVFGKRTGRIALIRLSSGNTVKVKVGQEFGDGWRVIGIDLDKIHITNGSRQETLRIPG